MNSEIKQFIQSVRRYNPTAKTWRSYSSDLRLFANLTGEVSPTQVTPKDIDRFINEQVERGFKPTTINRHLGTVVSLYRFMGLSCPVRSRRHRLREPQRLAGCLKTLIGQPPERMLAWLFPFQKDGERQQFCFEHRKSTLGRLNQNAYPIRIEFIGINIANKMTKAALLIQDFPCFR